MNKRTEVRETDVRETKRPLQTANA